VRRAQARKVDPGGDQGYVASAQRELNPTRETAFPRPNVKMPQAYGISTTPGLLLTIAIMGRSSMSSRWTTSVDLDYFVDLSRPKSRNGLKAIGMRATCFTKGSARKYSSASK
jgi:hypothetical protein